MVMELCVDILPDEQLAIWKAFEASALEGFTLYGGTALAPTLWLPSVKSGVPTKLVRQSAARRSPISVGCARLQPPKPSLREVPVEGQGLFDAAPEHTVEAGKIDQADLAVPAEQHLTCEKLESSFATGSISQMGRRRS